MAEVYEVIRVIDHKPIFLKEHLNRLKKSLAHYHAAGEIHFSDIDWNIREIALADDRANFNIRVIVDVEMYEVDYEMPDGVYPTEDLRRQGVKLITLEHQRETPNIKVFRSEWKDRVNALKKEAGAFEILYTSEGRVLEASASNIFFRRGETWFTAPDEEVLLGVTRQKVLEAAMKAEIPVERRVIQVSELDSFEEAFLTGTSLHMLPVSLVDDRIYQVMSPQFEKLYQTFLKLVEEK